MRRHDADIPATHPPAPSPTSGNQALTPGLITASQGTTRVERALLTLYWALSGYGLRAFRPLSWLTVAMVASVVVMMLWGMPAHAPQPTTTGHQVAAGQMLTLVTDTPDPTNPIGPLTSRLTSERFEKSLRTVVNSVVFRSSGQDLTTTGTYSLLTLEIVSGANEVTVWDSNPTPPENLAPDPTRIGQHGLEIVRVLADLARTLNRT
ncbi:hypothetical protein ACWET9_45020 [Streptomyces sp. NPDC004059]